MADVFPLRNLPTDAEEWGRKVEERIYQAENRVASSGQSLSGLNRATGSTLDNLAYQIGEVQRLYDLIPVAYQRTSTQTGFSVPVTGAWSTIASTTLTLSKAGIYSVTAVASGQLVSGGTPSLVDASYRLVANGSASSVIPGLAATPTGTWVNNFMATWGWVIPVTVGSPVTISLECNPADAAVWPGGTGSYAVLSTFGTFTRN